MNHSIQRLDESGLVSLKELNGLFADVFEDVVSYASKIPSDSYHLSFLADKNQLKILKVLLTQVWKSVLGRHGNVLLVL